MLIFKCDVCGAEIIGKPFNRFNIQRKGGVGEDYRDNDLVISLQADVCDKCFRKKLVEALGIPKDCRYYKSLDKAKEAEKNVKNILELDITGATLLTAEEALWLPQRLLEYNNWWWLRSPCRDFDYVARVDYGGAVEDSYGNYVGHDNFAVRPVLKISNLESTGFQIGDTFEFGGKQFEIISGHLAFCLSDIGRCAFREDGKSSDANNYEKSDVKKYIDSWFKKVKETKG